MLTSKIKTRDTLWKITTRFDVSMELLVQLNNLRNLNKLNVEAELRILVLKTDSKDTAATSLAEFQPPPFSMSASMINGRRFVLFTSEYYPVPVPKDLIILHFLAGADAASAFRTWYSNPAHVATAYLVDTDGTINEPFDASYWAYHLGVKRTKGLQGKRSVGVEIVNVRPLKPSPTATTSLNWRLQANRGEKAQCQTTEAERYLKVPYWGIEYSAVFPNSQVDAVARLVGYVSEFFGIQRVIPSQSRWQEYDLAYFSKYRGVSAHQKFRRDKWDVSPALNWDHLRL